MERNRNLFFTVIVVLVLVSSLVGQDKLNLNSIRIEFQQEENILTTGEGRFMLNDSGVTPYTIDPPPHDRSYFQDQIVAVDNYFIAASDSRLRVYGQVFPRRQTSAYQMSQPMGYYNPNTTEEENNYYLAQLFVEAVKLADQDADITFADYDLVTIFHAGVGNDIDLGFDETPQDIPSLYISYDFLKKALGDTFSGIKVDNGDTVIKNGIILPETESQAGLELAITGIFAANIGSYLGMYDLFSPSTKRSGIGRFGLMDSGLFNLFGLAPALPCAFSRELMNWDEVAVQNSPKNNLSLQRLQEGQSNDPSIIKIPLNSDEYYLLEYRGDSDVNIDSLFAVLSEGRDTFPTYLEVLKTYLPDRIEVSDSTGVLLSVEDYDWGLPGSGILIWHIDQKVIREKKHLNAINDDRDDRGVDLEESDGSQDIGYEYSIIEPGFNSELGTWLDFWFLDNPAPLYKNVFSVSSAPNTRSNRNYSDSHITLSDFSNNDKDQISFDYTRDYYEEGFPVRLPGQANSMYTHPIVGLTEYANKKIIFTSDPMGTIYALSGSGKGFIYPDKLIAAHHSVQSLALLAMGDENSDGRFDRLIACSPAGYVDLFEFADSDADSLLDTVSTYYSNVQISAGPVVREPYFYIGTNSGDILRFTLTEGTLDSVYRYNDPIASFTVLSPADITIRFGSNRIEKLAPAIIDLDSDGENETVLFTTPDQISIKSTGKSYQISLQDSIISGPSFADVDGDGLFEILFNSTGTLFAINYNGSMVSNFPLALNLEENESLVGTPLVFDADDDDNSEILLSTSLGRIIIIDLKGEILPGFPTTSGDKLTVTPIAEDLDGDGFLEIYSLNTKGEFFAWQLEGSGKEESVWWNQSSYRADKNFFIEKKLNSVPADISELMPAASVFNYPNPNKQNFTTIRYFLKDDAEVNIKIFDLAGDAVTSFTGPGQGNIHNEKRWELSDVASGVYLCRVEANSGSDKSVKIIKIMVIK